jgi:hypothetical protein
MHPEREKDTKQSQWRITISLFAGLTNECRAGQLISYYLVKPDNISCNRFFTVLNTSRIVVDMYEKNA